MNKKEIKNYLEDLFEAANPGDLEKEDLINDVCGSIELNYRYGNISKEDMLECFEELGVIADLEAIEKAKIEYLKRKELKAKKRQEKSARK